MSFNVPIADTNTNTNANVAVPGSNVLYPDSESRYIAELLASEWIDLMTSGEEDGSGSLSSLFGGFPSLGRLVPPAPTAFVVSNDDLTLRLSLGFGGLASLTSDVQTVTSAFTEAIRRGTGVIAITSTFEPRNGFDNERNCGMSLEAIERSSRKEVVKEVTECYICLDSVLPGSCMRRLSSCDHRFCIDCIDPWLKRSEKCPVCKRIVAECINESES